MFLEPVRLTQTLALVLEFLLRLMLERLKPEQGVLVEQLMLTIGLPADETELDKRKKSLD